MVVPSSPVVKFFLTPCDSSGSALCRRVRPSSVQCLPGCAWFALDNATSSAIGSLREERQPPEVTRADFYSALARFTERFHAPSKSALASMRRPRTMRSTVIAVKFVLLCSIGE